MSVFSMEHLFCSANGGHNTMASGNLIKILSLSLLLDFLLIAFAATDPSDYNVLDEFRKGIADADRLGWPTDNEDPCGNPRWDHVSCDGSRVTQINLQNMSLVGTLPPDFNKLSNLENLGLQHNNFTGALPSFNGLSKLQYAYLGNNQFDRIPSDFFAGLVNLQVLSLDRNPLNQSTGWALPSDLANSAQLTELSLMECNLDGPLPDFLGNLRSLARLRLSYNRLTGEIPASYSGLPLQSLWLNNQEPGLSGRIDVIANMTFLQDAWLHGNQFSGTIPSSIGALTSLSDLWLSNNQLVGLVPSSLTNLPKLQTLHLENNAFMGPIPKVSFKSFTYSHNSFCQSTPGVLCSPEVTALLDFLDGVCFPQKLAKSWSGNDACTGSWLGVSCASGKTAVINLPNYNLNGTISPSLGELDSLAQIFLGDNNLSGTIPSTLASLKSLKVLNLSSNNISPPVPMFSSAVTVILDGNKLLDKDSGSPGGDGDTPSDSPGSGGSSSSSRTKTLAIIVPVIVGVSFIILVLLFLRYRKKWKRNDISRPSTIVIHPNDTSDPDKFVKIVVANNANNSAAASELDSSGAVESHVIETGNLVISVQVLRAATQNFAPENELGRGGFGVVYKGDLHDGTMIAVKRTESAALSNKAWDEFKAEIAVLSKVRHRNLVSILGYSVEDNEKLLVYEYMPQGALSKHLFQWRPMKLEPLSWKKRLNIALDVARGTEYLHNFANQCFIHRDLKSSNILLGDNYRAKISDFGLAKLAPDGINSVATKLAGTFGYLAPEYAVTGKVTTKVDVFSYGVVLMELLTGLKALDQTRSEESRYLAYWFCHMKSSREKLRSIIDPSLSFTDETFDSICIVAELAGHCASRDPHQRPDMGHAVNVLVPLVEKWKPADGEKDEYLGIDLGQPLHQMVMEWQAADGGTSDMGSLNLDCSKASVPVRPAGFAESFRSVDGR